MFSAPAIPENCMDFGEERCVLCPILQLIESFILRDGAHGQYHISIHVRTACLIHAHNEHWYFHDYFALQSKETHMNTCTSMVISMIILEHYS